MSHTYELTGYVSRVEADMLDTSMLRYAAVPGHKYLTITTRGGDHRFELIGREPELGTPVTITVVIG